jgi:methylenetetrahydrofolate dehydrogenase (NADP+)/methenyltetrahydrofolate cyclohydrolase
VTARILDGRAVAREIAEEVRAAAAALAGAGRPRPTIAVVRVGEDPASVRYARQAERVFAGAGLGFRHVPLRETTGDADLARSLRDLGADPGVTGVLLQLPLPAHLSRENAIEAIDPRKDVDGVNPLNAGRLFAGRGHYFAPATPLGGLELLRRSGIDLVGKHAVVVGRSEIVGRPLAMLLLREHATVTICHTRTPDLATFTRQADVLAVAAGRPALVTGAMIAPGAVVLDFGVNVDVASGQLVGDVDFASAVEVASAITPVPGGTGPLTNAMLLVNTMRAAKEPPTH